MLEKDIIYVYIFSTSDIDLEYDIPSFLFDKISRYKDINKRNIKLTKYNRLLKEIKKFGVDTSQFMIVNGKPHIDGLYISTSDSKLYYGFSFSLNNHGIDIEEELEGKKYKNLEKYLSNIKYDNDMDAVLKWTFEEAYSKYLGTGITKESLEEKKNIDDFYWVKKDKSYITVYKKNCLLQLRFIMTKGDLICQD